MYAIVNKYNEFATKDDDNPENTPLLFENEVDAQKYLVDSIWVDLKYFVVKCDVR